MDNEFQVAAGGVFFIFFFSLYCAYRYVKKDNERFLRESIPMNAKLIRYMHSNHAYISLELDGKKSSWKIMTSENRAKRKNYPVGSTIKVLVRKSRHFGLDFYAVRWMDETMDYSGKIIERGLQVISFGFLIASIVNIYMGYYK